LRSSCAPLV